MAELALIGGHSILGAEPGEAFTRRRVETARGPVDVYDDPARDLVLMQRHGLSEYRTAARIDHARNLAALVELGCERVLALASVGGLRPELGVGTYLLPDDFIALHLGLSLDEGHGGERIPGFDSGWRERVRDAWNAAAEPPLVDGGVYWQAIGPRFETPAEIRLIAEHAHVIGMTVASECILAGELGLAYTAICGVDNLANGVAEQALTVADFEAGKEANRARMIEAVNATIAELGR